MGFNDVFGGTAIYPSNATYIALTLTADVELSWPIEQQIGGDQIVADIIDLNSSIAALSVILPDARNASQGFTTLFNNVGAENVTIKNALGGTLATVVPGSAWQIYLTDNSTEDGTWQTFQYGASISVANAAALVGNGLINIGLTLALNLDVTAVSTTPQALDANSRARIFNWTSGVAAFSVPSAATLGDGWFAILRNSGSGNLVVTPTSGTIDGGPDVTLAPGGSLIVVSDGTNYLTLFSSTGGSGGDSFNLLSVDVAGAGDYTLSGAQLGQVGYKFTGVLTGNRNIIVPGTVAQYWVDNSTTGAFSLFVKTVAQVTGIEVIQGTRNILYCDGTNVVAAESASVTFPIAIVNGGTGAITAAAARTNLGVPPTTRTITAGTGLTGGGDLSTDRTIALAILGLENLTDPGADRIMFWDDSAGFLTWLSLAGGLAISGTVLNSLAPPNAAAWANGEVMTVAATLNTSDMSAGYTFGVYNDSGSNITITQGGGVTLRMSGTTNTGNRIVVPRGFAIIWCKSGTEAIMSGDIA